MLTKFSAAAAAFVAAAIVAGSATADQTSAQQRIAITSPNGNSGTAVHAKPAQHQLDPATFSISPRAAFCSPTATVCNTLQPGPIGAPDPFCAPTETVCNTLQPGGSPAMRPAPPDRQQTLAREKRAAAWVSVREANAMQARAVARGEANSVLANPYIEQKVTTPEPTGHNATHIPAGGF
jgi:hypothetical protein